jgi:hypothetical protein
MMQGFCYKAPDRHSTKYIIDCDYFALRTENVFSTSDEIADRFVGNSVVASGR